MFGGNDTSFCRIHYFYSKNNDVNTVYEKVQVVKDTGFTGYVLFFDPFSTLIFTDTTSVRAVIIMHYCF